MEKPVIGAERNSLKAESVGAVTNTTEIIGTITTTDTPGKPLDVEINIDASTAEGRKIWRSITSSPVSKSIKLWGAGTISITFNYCAESATKKKPMPKGDVDGNSIKYSGDYL